ncbi:MAG: Asp-tRNA(Asn)/Glu-tRNA(Gln) amidotransferase subunit GatA [Candidatus Tectomicrobia bacterium]|uniref:Glutamyl-tRNA(Gln) amidotransferase subunit A n=1 Tax=Tectimicrobiota bacterium TaxID=2528274 RepID=A0A932CNK5_UNCTE|nr:Asp-tRNA(Asn)/Glu-tRNA(Gln) amidotransferase subunit GatA [Candidatus Tectomicrobia bacterium]
MELYAFTVHEIRDKLKKREVSAKEVTEAVLRRIEEVEEQVHAYITLTPEEALRQAEEADRLLSRGGEVPPLTGIPLAIKDNMCTRGIRTTCASHILDNFVPPYDATVICRLKAQGGTILVGKANMDQFAMGSSTETSHFGTTRNPWDLERVPGGSSGGSAAAVAAGECLAALGSDTGGSIRQPASHCGIVGMKPTYGRVSRFGLVAFASSLDQIGPMTRDVADTALLLKLISGKDPYDSTSVDLPVPDYEQALIPEVQGMKIGIPQEYFVAGMDPQVAEKLREVIRAYEALGAHCQEVSLPHTPYALATYYILATAEASSNLARYDGVKYGYRTPEAKGLMEMYYKTREEGFGAEVKRRIMLGTYALSAGYYEAYYRKAQQVRTLFCQDFQQAFEAVDLLLIPTSPTPAFKIGEKTDDPLQMYLSDIFTISANLGGLPAICLPCGLTREGLPVGFQLLGRLFDEATLLRAAYAYEQHSGHHRLRPRIEARPA